MRFTVTSLVAVFIFFCGPHVYADEQETASPTSTEAGPRIVIIDVWFVTAKNQAGEVPQSLLAITGSLHAGAIIGDRYEFIGKLADLEKRDLISTSHHLRASTVASNELIIRIGEDKPTVTGVTQSNLGISRSVNFKSVGMLLRTTPDILAENRMRVPVVFEASVLVDSDVVMFETADGAHADTGHGVELFAAETTVDVDMGYACLVAGTAVQRSGQPSGHLLVICASSGNP